ncbi:MAG: DEAD/DEAH box helicase [Acidobacteria bacterium]|nr:DEAD/DEAH box helicase [Acidobacteriota bacterium]
MTDLADIEFHRTGYGMLPDSRDKDPGAPVCFPRAVGGSVFTGFCNCRARRRTDACGHFSRLVQIAREIRENHPGRHWGEVYAASLWYRLAELLSEADPLRCEDTRVIQPSGCRTPAFVSARGTLLARLLDESAASGRFIERAGKLPQPNRFTDRAALIHRIIGSLRTEEEAKINEAGVFTRRQSAEQSFWGRLAYHCYREYGDDCVFHPAIEESSGDFILKCFSRDSAPLVELAVPRRQVRRVLRLLAEHFPGQSDLAIHPVPLRSVFLVTQETQLDLEVRPVIQALQSSGESRFYDSKECAGFRYGDLVYIPELHILAELETPGSGRRFTTPVSMRLEKSRLPAFLDEHRQEIQEGLLVLEERLRHLSVLREYDRIEIVPDAIERSWYWLSIRYRFGDASVSLADIMETRRRGLSYLPIGQGWVDVNSPAFAALDAIQHREELEFSGEKVRLAAIDLLRLMASGGKPVQVKEENRRAEIVRRLLALAPGAPAGGLKGMRTPLRPYQLKGFDWLRFLYENGLSGLLCDDMGLGKTHQAMALMVWLRERQRVKGPFLVVCPTTVISHWMNKIREHAPKLKPAVYHGLERDLDEALEHSKLLLTSYGILRNDVVQLRQVPFSLVIFDEIQNLKNRETLSYQAASALPAKMKLGLTGTPIENSLADLKSLFDIVLPGYLGSDEDFAAKCLEKAPQGEAETSTAELRRLITPFVLRRLKSAVLDELPEKFEDLRTCALSDMQVSLYREAISTRGRDLVRILRSDSRQLPYIHIFALLNLLKRICDHPALALNKVGEYQGYESGKWELFQELLFESLDSGQKVVVFSQYLGMISMMQHLLSTLGVGFITLTGASTDRGEIVRRFNEDPACRVYLGSLKAGGAGIDLVAGSVVIHYDRWWNAAREDQATDRVHRIGQRRAVQVFKLITEGTLEEKISAIVSRKRRLMDSVVQADDPHLSKIFTREELIELLRPPGRAS